MKKNLKKVARPPTLDVTDITQFNFGFHGMGNKQDDDD